MPKLSKKPVEVAAIAATLLQHQRWLLDPETSTPEMEQRVIRLAVRVARAILTEAGRG